MIRRLGSATRLAAANAAVLAAVLAVAVLLLLNAFDTQSTNNATRSLISELSSFSTAVTDRSPREPLRRFADEYLRTHVLPSGDYVIVTLPDHSVLGSAGSGALLTNPLIQSWAARPPATGVQQDLGGEDPELRVVATPLVADGRTIGTAIVAGDLSSTKSDLDRVRALVLAEAALALLVGTAAAYLLLRSLLRRIGRITATAAEIGSGDLDRRLGDQGTDDEVGRLAQTFDAMADRLAAAMMAQRRLLSDVSHQLRTPLTVARGHLEVLARTGVTDPREVHQTVDLVVDELDHMRALVERLLMLGHALEPDFIDRQPVDLRALCADLVDAAHVLGDRQWLLGPVPDVVVEVDEPKLRGAMLNLVDNAAHATRDGDTIEISAAVQDDALLLSVDDSGPGIAPAARAKVLERFDRAGAADSQGSGLGLAIVKAVAEAHGGGLELSDSRLGGLHAELRLPHVVRSTVTAD